MIQLPDHDHVHCEECIDERMKSLAMIQQLQQENERLKDALTLECEVTTALKVKLEAAERPFSIWQDANDKWFIRFKTEEVSAFYPDEPENIRYFANLLNVSEDRIKAALEEA